MTNGSAKCWLAVDVDEVAFSGGVGFDSAHRAGSQSKAHAGNCRLQLFAGSNIERAETAVLHMPPNPLLFADMQLTVDEAVQRARINMSATQLISNHRDLRTATA